MWKKYTFPIEPLFNALHKYRFRRKAATPMITSKTSRGEDIIDSAAYVDRYNCIQRHQPAWFHCKCGRRWRKTRKEGAQWAKRWKMISEQFVRIQSNLGHSEESRLVWKVCFRGDQGDAFGPSALPWREGDAGGTDKRTYLEPFHRWAIQSLLV